MARGEQKKKAEKDCIKSGQPAATTIEKTFTSTIA